MFDFNFCSRYIIEYILPAFFFCSFLSLKTTMNIAVVWLQYLVLRNTVHVWYQDVRSWLDAWPDSYSCGRDPQYVFSFASMTLASDGRGRRQPSNNGNRCHLSLKQCLPWNDFFFLKFPHWTQFSSQHFMIKKLPIFPCHTDPIRLIWLRWWKLNVYTSVWNCRCW